MKLRFALLMLIATSFVSASGFAQTTVTKGNVPFSFYLGDKLMPAGNYIVRAVADHALQVAQTDGRARQLAIVLTTGPASGLATSKMVFDRADGEYILSAIVDANKDVRINLPTSSAHHEATRKQLADWQYQGSK